MYADGCEFIDPEYVPGRDEFVYGHFYLYLYVYLYLYSVYCFYFYSGYHYGGTIFISGPEGQNWSTDGYTGRYASVDGYTGCHRRHRLFIHGRDESDKFAERRINCESKCRYNYFDCGDLQVVSKADIGRARTPRSWRATTPSRCATK